MGENEVVLQKKKIDGEQAKICGENRQVSREEAAKEKRNDREQRQPGVKKRENPKKPASIEDAEIVLGPTGIEKNAANQKSGKDEEQVHTGPAKTEGATEAIKETAERAVLTVVQIMKGDHEQDGDTAEAIELGDTAREEGKIPGLGGGRNGARVKGIHEYSFRASGKRRSNGILSY